jgi:AbiU2
MTTPKADDYKARFVSAMGEPLGEQFHALWLDVTWLHIKWSQFVEIFGTDAARITLLNRAAGSFFRIVEGIFLNDVMLNLTRLTDPSRSVKKPNLTILNFPGLIPDPETKATVLSLVEDAERSTKFARDWRKRHIAHRDLDRALNPQAHPLEPATRDDVAEALSAISEVMYAVRRAYMGASPCFQAGHTIGGAIDLLKVLEDGVSAKTSKR